MPRLPLWLIVMAACLLTAAILFTLSTVLIKTPARAADSAAGPLPIGTVISAIRPTVDPNDPLARGRYAYEVYCAHCHGYNGEGEGPRIDTTKPDALGYMPVPRHDNLGHTWLHPDQLLIGTIRQGLPNPLYRYQMPAFAPDVLSDQQISDILLYIKQWWTPEQRAAQAAATDRLGKALAELP